MQRESETPPDYTIHAPWRHLPKDRKRDRKRFKPVQIPQFSCPKIEKEINGIHLCFSASLSLSHSLSLACLQTLANLREEVDNQAFIFCGDLRVATNGGSAFLSTEEESL